MKNRIDSGEVLTKLFGSISRARILAFLYAYAGQSFYQQGIMFETGLSLRPVQRELDNLVDFGILKRQETHNRVFYEVDSIFFKPLMQIYGLAQQRWKKGTGYFWLRDLSDSLNLLTSFLSQI